MSEPNHGEADDNPGADRSPLRQALDAAIAESNGSKLSMKDLTVLSPQIDPFRLDTQANHKIARPEGAELGEGVAEHQGRRQVGSERRGQRQLMDLVLRIPCSRHDALSGEPCWSDPRAICGARIAGARAVKTRIRSRR